MNTSMIYVYIFLKMKVIGLVIYILFICID